jgi:hypothetical protein
MRRKLTVAIAAAALAAVPATAAMADSHEDAEVVVVHGVPGLTVDVLVDGEAAIEGFDFADDPVVTSLPAGDYTLGVAEAGSTDAILSADVTLEAGASYSAVAYLDTAGEPTLGAFGNETDATGIQAFHTANFDPVSIIAGGEIALDDVANGDTARIDVPGGTDVEGVGIGVAGSADAAIDLGTVTVPENTLVLAYAIGPDEGEELPAVVTAAVDVMTDDAPEDDAAEDDTTDEADHDDDAEEVAQPHSVDSGTGGLVANGMPLWVASLMALGVLALAVPVAATARRRR